MPCYKSGGCGVYEMYSCSECPASKPSYLKPKEPKVTNEHAIRHLWTTEQLAHVLIERREEEDWDYDIEDEPYVCGHFDVYTTSDGQEFSDYDEAVEHEVWWLSQEVQNGE